MSQDMTQIDDRVIADDTCEVHLFSICLHGNDRREDKREECINHRHRREPSTISTYEPSSLVIVLLASVSDMPHHPIIKLVSEVIDRISIEFNICFFVDSFKSQFIKVAWSSQLLILKHVAHFIVAEYSIFGKTFLFRKDIRFELLILVILLVSLFAVS
jgi:hypothetical protein